MSTFPPSELNESQWQPTSERGDELKFAVQNTETIIMQACKEFEKKMGMQIETISPIKASAIYHGVAPETIGAKITISI